MRLTSGTIGPNGGTSCVWTAVAEVREWQLQVQRDLMDTSILSDSVDQRGWKKSYPGLRGWSGSMTVHWDMTYDAGQQHDFQDLLIGDDPVDGPQRLGVQLKVDATHGYEGYIYIQNMSISVNTTGIVTAQISFTGTAKLYINNSIS
jgi:hypothetical protein